MEFYGENNDFWNWIDEHAGDDPTKLRFAAQRWPEPWIHEAIGQIDRRQRAARKLPVLAANPRFYFPSDLSVEQSTSERLARYHARWFANAESVVDLTAGLGVDALTLAQSGIKEVVAVEREPLLAHALEYNAKLLGLNNLHVVNDDCRQYLAKTGQKFSAAFIDPARRGLKGERIFALSQCHPNVVTMLYTLRMHADKLVVKASPMLDVSATIEELKDVTNIIALGNRSECKELDVIVDLTASQQVEQPSIDAVTLLADDDKSIFSFTRMQEAAADVKFGNPAPGDYLYIPYPSVKKVAPIKLLSQRFGLTKVSANTHIYFAPADVTVNDFPGERHEILEVLPYASSIIKRLARRFPQAMVATRNMGLTAEQLRAKLRIKDGGEIRVIGFSAADASRHLLIVK